jgi:hypothetical protein
VAGAPGEDGKYAAASIESKKSAEKMNDAALTMCRYHFKVVELFPLHNDRTQKGFRRATSPTFRAGRHLRKQRRFR